MSQLIDLVPRRGQIALRWLGQGGFAFRSAAGVVWCVDPYLSDYSTRGRVARLAPPPIAPDTMDADAVLCTHDHTDHVDPVTLPAIARSCARTRFVAAAQGAGHMQEMGISPGRVRAIVAGETFAVGNLEQSDVRATVVFAEHGGDAVGYVFSIGEAALRVYITGDTLYSERLLSTATLGCDVLCVCINGRLGNMTHEEAVRLTQEVGPKVVVPMHYGVMPHNTIDPQLFVDALQAEGLPARPVVLQIGETRVLP